MFEYSLKYDRIEEYTANYERRTQVVLDEDDDSPKYSPLAEENRSPFTYSLTTYRRSVREWQCKCACAGARRADALSIVDIDTTPQGTRQSVLTTHYRSAVHSEHTLAHSRHSDSTEARASSCCTAAVSDRCPRSVSPVAVGRRAPRTCSATRLPHRATIHSFSFRENQVKYYLERTLCLDLLYVCFIGATPLCLFDWTFSEAASSSSSKQDAVAGDAGAAHAGMERWQTTLEDMIHLRSPNNQAFKDNYWAQNGFDELRRYVKQGSDFSKELTAILQERVEAENYYSKCLAKLGTKLSKACKESVGSCADAWKHVALEMDKRSEIHRNYSSALSEELVKPMKHVIDGQLKLRKKIEGNVDKVTRSLVEWRSAEAKSKRQSHAAARENEKLQDAALDTSSRMARSSSVGHIPQSMLSAARAERTAAGSERDAAKLQLKRRKTEDAVKKAEVEYYSVCVAAERARLEWETGVVKGAGMLESLEEERLAQLKSAADCYLRLAAAVPPQLADASNALAAPIAAADANVDMRVVRGVRGAPVAASDQLLPDFYCEHTTLAMNKERRKQALVKILQLVKQDIERERKSKQGLEKLSMAMKQTPTFGSDDSQQNVADKLYHMKSMLTYLEAVRYKTAASLSALDARPPAPHPLAAHIRVLRDKQGLQQSILKVPPWLQTDYQNEVNKNLQPNYTALSKSVNGEERERRDSIMSRASSKLRIEHLSFRRHAEHKSAPPTPCAEAPHAAPASPAPPPPDSPLDWSERGAGDGLSNQQDSDFDEFSSQSDSSTEARDEPAPAPATPQHEYVGKCRALYSYEARLDDELTLSPGDVINIYEKQDDVWWSGDLNGAFGIFPSSYVEEITSCI